MQDQINFIINNINLSKEDKINLLKELFLSNTKITFTDFDDTITNNNNIYYSKVKFYKNNNLFFHKIISDFSINNNFLNIIKQYNIKNLIILTRNSQEFINFFIENTKDYFDSIWVNIIWWIWYSNNFNINSFDKINIVPIKSFLVSDIYEFVYFRKHMNFLCVDKFSFVRLINISLIKLFYFLMFILFNE